MIDIHNHILFSIDDGSKNLNESVQIVREAYQNGYTDLILTPHFRSFQNFTADNNQKKTLFKELVEAVKQAGIPVNLYLGNEITVDGDLFSYLDNNQVLTLNNSRYILLELPFHSKFAGIHDLIFKLRSLGYVPILAHPERYDYYSDVKEFEDMINEGALLQGNIGSLYRKYGSFAHDRLEELIKRHMIHFIGSDVHHAGQTSYTRINDVAHRIKILSGSESMALDLVQNNLRSVINNETIDPYTIRRPSSKLKFHLFRKES